MIIPRNDRVVVKLPKAKDVTEGGIILPDNAQQMPTEGPVTAIGPLIQDIAVGDVVMFDKYGGTEVDVDGEIHVIVRESQIYAFRWKTQTA